MGGELSKQAVIYQRERHIYERMGWEH